MCGVIVVDAESIGLLVSDVMPICMIIALDIVMTLHGSINCSMMTHKYRGSIIVLLISKSVEPNKDQKALINGFQQGNNCKN